MPRTRASSDHTRSRRFWAIDGKKKDGKGKEKRFTGLISALLLLYDVTNKTSFDNIRAWLSEIREHANEDVVIMLLGESPLIYGTRAVADTMDRRAAHLVVYPRV